MLREYSNIRYFGSIFNEKNSTRIAITWNLEIWNSKIISQPRTLQEMEFLIKHMCFTVFLVDSERLVSIWMVWGVWHTHKHSKSTFNFTSVIMLKIKFR